ncbi:MAG: sulfatase-like hydrolase/transferase, partial [Acidobacteriota bacterium]
MKTCLGKIRCCLGRRMGLWLLALSLPATVCLAATAHATDPPHVIYIMMDDLGYGSLSSYGSPFIDTPEIDAFANEGALFTQYYVNSPVCSPSRVSVLTSLPPRFFNIRDALATGANGSHFSQVGIPDYVLTLPEFLKQHQYRTVHLGKWHVGGFEKIADAVHLTPGADIEFLPSAAGFDEWIVRVPSKSRNNYWQEYMQPHDGPGFCVHDEANTTATECRGTETTQHLTEWLVDEAIEVIDSHDPTEPLFLNVWLRAPHLPYNSPASLAGGFTQAEQYELLVEYADEQIGRLVDKAATLGTNTLVFVTSDNGAQSAQPGSPLEPIAPNGDLLGKKGQLWEGGIRVPMMVRWPAQVAPALEVSFPASSFDVFATLVDILGDEVEPLDLAG